MQLTLFQIALIGIFTAICWTGMLLGTYMLRPIILATGIGLILGDVNTGLFIGAIAELTFMGFGVGAGGTVPPSPLGPGIVGTLIAISSKIHPAAAFTLSIPFAIAFQFLQTRLYKSMYELPNFAKKSIEEGKFLKFKIYANLTFITFFVSGIILGIICSIFIPYISNFINIMPAFLIKSLKLSGQLLPSIGFAMILSGMTKKEFIPYMILGYISMAYLKLPVSAVLLISIASILFYVFKLENNDTSSMKEDEVEFEDGI